MPTIHVTNMEINNVNDKQENNLTQKSIYQKEKTFPLGRIGRVFGWVYIYIC